MITENLLYGTSMNPADSLPKQGKRTLDLEREVTVIIYLICLVDLRKGSSRDEGKGDRRRKAEKH
jgi:hypothetical protein